MASSVARVDWGARMSIDQLRGSWAHKALADVRSETGILRRVLVHRPGQELDRLDRDGAAALLFDDVPRLAAARAEHDALTATMREAAVEVLYLEDLLTGALRDPAIRPEAIDQPLATRPAGGPGVPGRGRPPRPSPRCGRRSARRTPSASPAATRRRSPRPSSAAT